MSNQDQLVPALTGSQVYREYERAFTDATGMPVALRPVESWHLPHHQRRNENRFCSLMAGQSRSCASCLRIQHALCQSAVLESRTVSCPHGLSESAVPVRLGERLIGYLQTGQVFRKKPTDTQFDRTLHLTSEWGIEVDADLLRAAYFETRLLSPRQYDSMLKLLMIFSQHLSMVSNQVVVRQENIDPPIIARAKQFIREHQGEDITLSQVAKVSNTSTYYFCKVFRKVTGLNFTEYVARVRIEKAKNLLLNPNLRVSEVAYDVGFQSLTHFNRVFKRIQGQSPSLYRDQLMAA